MTLALWLVLLVAGLAQEPPPPVLLVPGWGNTAEDLAALEERFVRAGWPEESVLRVGFNDPVGSNRDHADELTAAAVRLLERTGAERLDIVAHSMGGLALRQLFATGGGAWVRRAVFLGTPQRGTITAYLARGSGGRDMRPGSPLLEELEGYELPEGVRALTVRTAVDTHIVPGENAFLPGVERRTLCCSTHKGLLRDDATFEVVLEFLRRPGPQGD